MATLSDKGLLKRLSYPAGIELVAANSWIMESNFDVTTDVIFSDVNWLGTTMKHVLYRNDPYLQALQPKGTSMQIGKD